MSQKYYINTAIPYVNGKPHIGHGLEFVYADVVARYYRCRHQWGRPEMAVHFVTGADEHGQKIATAAAAQGVSPQELADTMSNEFRLVCSALNISFDDFIRTTEQRHIITAQRLWKRIADAGAITTGEYEGLYCVGCEEFKLEKDLVDGKCSDHQKVPERVKETNYFFRLSAWQEQLRALFDDPTQFRIVPQSRMAEMRAVLDEGLEDISISRDRSKLSWGVPVPDDDTQVMYVWFEALMNYVSAVGCEVDDALFQRWWPQDVVVIGKGIHRFHSLIWPAMLMAAGLPVPRSVAVHGYVTVEGQKMSKSIGNVVDPIEVVERYGVDSVRYYLLRDIPFDSDGDFSFARLEQRYSSDLSNGLGNLVSRVTTMVERNCNGQVNAALDESLLSRAAVQEFVDRTADAIEQFQFHRALETIWALLAIADGTVEREKPWAAAKTDPERAAVVLGHLVALLQQSALLLTPFLPQTAEQIGAALRGKQISKVPPLFPRRES